MTPSKSKIRHEEKPQKESILTESVPLADVKAALSSRYEILENLGKAEVCTVYRAVERRSNVEVALEILPPHLVQNEEYVRRFHKEANIASRLNNRNISKVYDEGVYNGVHFVTVEYLDGLDFHTMVMWKGRIDSKDVVKLLVPTIEALAYAHEKGLIHRDLRSSNIIITDVGRPVLTDFWIDHSSRGTKLSGALEYMSPEEVEGKELTRSSNIYCFGVILYEALTGKVPFSGSNPFEIVGKIISNRPIFPRKIAYSIPDWIEEIVMRCLAKNPDDRFSSAAELAASLLRGHAPVVVSQPVQQRPAASHISGKIKSKPPAPRPKKNDPTTIESKPSSPDDVQRKDVIEREAREKSEAERRKAEAEKERIETERRKAEAEKERIETERRKARVEKERLEIERREAEAEKEKIELERRKAEAEKKKAAVEERKAGVPPVEKKIVIDLSKEPKQSSRIKPLLRIAIPLALVAIALVAVISNPGLLRRGEESHGHDADGESVSGKTIVSQTKRFEESGSTSIQNATGRGSSKTLAEEVKPTPAIAKEKSQQAALTPLTIPVSTLPKGSIKEPEKVAVNIPSPSGSLVVKGTSPEKVVPRLPIIDIQWVHVDSGSFQMGSDNYPSTKPIHSVKVGSFYMSATEITFEQYDKFCDATHSKKPDDNGWGRGKMPVINVSWNDAIAFCQWFSDQTGKAVRLPTEAEYEFAARGGDRAQNYAYSGNNTVDLVAWYADNSGGKPHVVGTKLPNELGLYDMSGNVWEWCQDWYHQSYDGAPANGKTWNIMDKYNPYRVLRGGSANGANYCSQVSFRFWLAPFYRDKSIGFRVVRDAK